MRNCRRIWLKSSGITVNIDSVRGIAPDEHISQRVRPAIVSQLDPVAITGKTDRIIEGRGDSIVKRPGVGHCDPVLRLPEVEAVVTVVVGTCAANDVASTQAAEFYR